jgi:hypothetical protein
VIVSAERKFESAISNAAITCLVARYSARGSIAPISRSLSTLTISGPFSTCGTAVLNPDLYFCAGLACAIGDSAKSYYRDADHLNANGVGLMAPLLRALLT